MSIMRPSVLLLLVHVVIVSGQQLCDDVDTEACRLMHEKQTDICQNPAVAGSLCKRFCNLCPMECYHCDVTVQDYHLCNTTKLCNSGEVCMKKELRSFIDGHHEYQLTCSDIQICDGGQDLVIPFGKRMVLSRDVSVTCCTGDRCNYPGSIQTTTPPTPTTTTAKPTTPPTTTPFTACLKDIIFIVDQANWQLMYGTNTLLQLMRDVINQLPIGMHDNLMSYFIVESHGKKLFDLDDNRDRTSLLMHLEHNINNHIHNDPSKVNDNLHTTIRDVVDKLQGGRMGDRTNYDNAVVLIGFENTFSYYNPTQYTETLSQISNDVTTVLIGPTSATTMTAANRIASDTEHVLMVTDLRVIDQLANQLVRLIGKC